MEAPRSKICLQTTLLFVIVFVFVVNVTSSKHKIRLNDKIYSKPTFTLKINGFSRRDGKDPEILKVAKFAIDEHNSIVAKLQDHQRNKKTGEPCTSCDQQRTWEFVEVVKARKLNINKNEMKYALIISATNGPIGDFCEAMVDVINNRSKLVAFIEPKDDAIPDDKDANTNV